MLKAEMYAELKNMVRKAENFDAEGAESKWNYVAEGLTAGDVIKQESNWTAEILIGNRLLLITIIFYAARC